MNQSNSASAGGAKRESITLDDMIALDKLEADVAEILESMKELNLIDKEKERARGKPRVERGMTAARRAWMKAGDEP